MPGHWHFWVQLFKMAERGGNEEVINLNSFHSHRGKGEYWFVQISEPLCVKLCLERTGFIDTKLAGLLLMETCLWSVLLCHTPLCSTSQPPTEDSFYADVQNIWLLSFWCFIALRQIAGFLGTPHRGISADLRGSLCSTLLRTSQEGAWLCIHILTGLYALAPVPPGVEFKN